MGRSRAILVSTLFWSYVVVSSFVLWLGALLVFCVTAPFDRERRALHLYSCAWAYHYVLLMPQCHSSIEGRTRIDPKQTYVLVANHQSLCDVPLLFGLFRHFKWVSKRAVFRVPILGWNMSLNNYVQLVRGDRKSIAQMLRNCQGHLKRGSSMLLFPEGTRSPDGEIQPFLPGAVSMARRAGAMLLPVVIDGTRDVLPKHGLVFDQSAPRHLCVRVLEPIDPSSLSAAEANAALHTRMCDELRKMRAHQPA